MSGSATEGALLTPPLCWLGRSPVQTACAGTQTRPRTYETARTLASGVRQLATDAAAWAVSSPRTAPGSLSLVVID